MCGIRRLFANGHALREGLADQAFTANLRAAMAGDAWYRRSGVVQHELEPLLCGERGVAVPSGGGIGQGGEQLGGSGVGAVAEVVGAS